MSDLKLRRLESPHCKRAGMNNPTAVYNALEAECRASGNVQFYVMMFPHRCCNCGGRCRQYIKFTQDADGTVRHGREGDSDCCVIGSCCWEKYENE